MRWLVDKAGADVDARTKDGRTVLHAVAAAGRWDAVRWLVDKGGADVNAADKDGRTVLQVMVAAGRGLNLMGFSWPWTLRMGGAL